MTTVPTLASSSLTVVTVLLYLTLYSKFAPVAWSLCVTESPCPLPSPGDELLSSSSHRTLSPHRPPPRRAASQSGPGRENLVRTRSRDSDNVLELGRPGPPCPGHKQRMRFLSGGGRKGRARELQISDRYGRHMSTCHDVNCDPILAYQQADTGLSASTEPGEGRNYQMRKAIYISKISLYH